MLDEGRDILEPLTRLGDVQIEDCAVERAMGRVRAALAASAEEPCQGEITGQPVQSVRVRRFGAVKWLIPVAAAAAVVLAVGLWPTSKPAGRGGHVYALSDVPELLRNARYLHVCGYRLIPPVPVRGQERVRVAFEYWIDTVHGRTRFPYVGYKRGASAPEVVVRERVSDGAFEMELNHTARTARFQRLGALQQRLQTGHSLDSLIGTLFVDPARLGGFTCVGKESIGAAEYEVWEGQLGQDADAVLVRSWLDPVSGKMARSQTFWKHGGNWVEESCTELVEWGVAPPAGVFETQPPAGYTSLNNKETAPAMPVKSNWAQSEDLTWTSYIGFVLEDGSVIAGWSCVDRKSATSQEDLFKGLSFGGELPKLPVEVYGLTSVGRFENVTYTGRHLAWTRKAGQYVEWALYVPDRPPPAGILGYGTLFRTHLDRPLAGSINPGVPGCVQVNAGNFEAFVVAAMAELSDDGVVPGLVTYAAVMQLSQQARPTLP